MTGLLEAIHEAKQRLYYRRCRRLTCKLGGMHTHHLTALGRLRYCGVRAAVFGIRG